MLKDRDGNIFCVCLLLELYQLRKKKLKKVINFTGSGLFWTQLGLCILHSVGARVKLIKDADIQVQLCLYLIIFSEIIQRKSVTSMSAYWNPKPTPTHKPVPLSEMKVSKSSLMKKKRKITPYDDSWIDSFDPRPMKSRKEIIHMEKINIANKLRKIDPCKGILGFLPFSPNYDENENFSSHPVNNISHLIILSQAKNYVKKILISHQRTTFQILLNNF